MKDAFWSSLTTTLLIIGGMIFTVVLFFGLVIVINCWPWLGSLGMGLIVFGIIWSVNYRDELEKQYLREMKKDCFR